MQQFENRILRLIANGASLNETMGVLCQEVEALLPGVICSVMIVDTAGLLRSLAAPSLPDEYAIALDGVMVGPEAGSCGTAAYMRVPIGTTDIATDPRWAKHKDHAFLAEVRSCWSYPVLSEGGEPIGVLGLYFRESREPAGAETAVIKVCLELVAVALRRHERVLDRERRANVDALSGLPNRAAFNAALERVPCDEPGAWALLMIDLDNLKVVNDTFGHLAGDALIRVAANRIASVMAPDVTFRIGGDEFAVLVQAPAMLADLDGAAKRIFDTLEVGAPCEGHIVVPRATIGGAVFGQSEPTASAVSEAADFALYHAKETGRGGFVRYWPGIGTRIAHRRDAIRDVAEALGDGRIEPHYQPVVRLDTGEIVGVEALCCMRSLDGALIAAKEFHEATTDAHVAAELTGHMLSMVARDMRHWLDADLPVEHVGINVSTADFYVGSIARRLEDAFGTVDVPLSRLVLEVSEDVYLGRRDRVVAREIAALREAGVLVALDDFGTGFASLTHLLNVPVDIIKIDRSFVARLWPDDPSMVIVEGLIDIARRLGIRVVAEGIETEVQASQLWSMGCVLGQGFAFAYPADRLATAVLLRKHARGHQGATPLYAGRTPGVLSGDAIRSQAAPISEKGLASPRTGRSLRRSASTKF
ncbi:GGDEF domain-containing protein [Xanthobacter autotrophicus]|uniref:putative bifunctional diguanylate cyclase/phosphodiesterase n=1 Tax=Xanthobacter autotrophicus TaxID=280 RepID=UPI0037266885